MGGNENGVFDGCDFWPNEAISAIGVASSHLPDLAATGADLSNLRLADCEINSALKFPRNTKRFI